MKLDGSLSIFNGDSNYNQQEIKLEVQGKGQPWNQQTNLKSSQMMLGLFNSDAIFSHF